MWMWWINEKWFRLTWSWFGSWLRLRTMTTSLWRRQRYPELTTSLCEWQSTMHNRSDVRVQDVWHVLRWWTSIFQTRIQIIWWKWVRDPRNYATRIWNGLSWLRTWINGSWIVNSPELNNEEVKLSWRWSYLSLRRSVDEHDHTTNIMNDTCCSNSRIDNDEQRQPFW